MCGVGQSLEREPLGQHVMSVVGAARDKWHRLVKSPIEAIKLSVKESPVAQYRPVVLVWRAVREMGHDDATLLAAGIAFYFLFSLFPLLLGLLAIAGMVFNTEVLQQRFLDFVGENLPGGAGFVERNVRETVRLRGVLGIGAIVGMLWTASAVFAAISKAINRAWGVQQDRPFYIAKPRHLAMALIVLVLFLISATLTAVILPLTQRDLAITGQVFLPHVPTGELPLRALSWLMSFGIFLLIYRFIPNCKTYWRYVWPGAAIAATLFELGKSGFVWYLEEFANYSQVYGSLASVIVLLFWAYLSALILLLGAEISSESEKLYHKQADTPGGDSGADPTSPAL